MSQNILEASAIGMRSPRSWTWLFIPATATAGRSGPIGALTLVPVVYCFASTLTTMVLSAAPPHPLITAPAQAPPDSHSNPNLQPRDPVSGSVSGSSPVSVSSANSGSSAISLAQTLPAGGVTITQPPQTATSFFKLAPDHFLTIGWNFTYVVQAPTSITVSAVCAANGNTYAVGPDPSGRIPGTATEVVWDVYSYQQAHPNTPLAQASYTLHMWDDRGPDATAAPGLMSPNNALVFALYTPQAYTPLASGWTCTGCSGALVAHPALAALLLTFLLMLFSGFRVLRRG
ncbi:hypothetical protein C8R46DRAFT_1123674, partial [Mycena filopes]